MPDATKVTLLEEEDAQAIKKDHFLLRLQLEFGPSFSHQDKFTLEELIAHLGDRAHDFPTSFVGSLLSFLAEYFDLTRDAWPDANDRKPRKVTLSVGDCPTCGDVGGARKHWVCWDPPCPLGCPCGCNLC